MVRLSLWRCIMSKTPKYRGADFVDFQLRVNVKKKRTNNNDIIPVDYELQEEIDRDLKQISEEIVK